MLRQNDKFESSAVSFMLHYLLIALALWLYHTKYVMSSVLRILSMSVILLGVPEVLKLIPGVTSWKDKYNPHTDKY